MNLMMCVNYLIGKTKRRAQMTQATVRKVVDLKGHQCPFTFVLTKAHLEEMDLGILEVIVDYPPSAENIPRSVIAQDLGKIISVEHIEGNTFKIIIQKSNGIKQGEGK